MSWVIAVVIIVAGLSIAVFSRSASARRKNRQGRGSLLENLVEWYQQMSQNRQCAPLRKKLLKLARSQDLAERLIDHEKRKNPGKPEHWYLEKIIYDLRRGR